MFGLVTKLICDHPVLSGSLCYATVLFLSIDRLDILMKMKIIKWGLVIVGLFALVLVAAPYLFKDRIVVEVKNGLNESIKAKTDFSNVSLSFFRSFPHL